MVYSENNRFVFPQLDGKDAYWQITYADTDSYYRWMSAEAKYIEYNKPELLIDCDSKSITNDEKISCNLNLKYYHNISKINFKINTDILEVIDFKQNENFTKEDVIKVKDIKYTDTFTDGTINDISTTITLNIKEPIKEEENPQTGIKNYQILIFIISILCMLSIYVFRSRDFIRKV